ncbi:epoxyqueuosine reductase QueH [Mammaliicoccus sciuri]|nr:epoxyqueuosine reductase QueH [Mammaliicoccus sciuri]
MNVGREFKKRLLNSLMSVQILMLNILEAAYEPHKFMKMVKSKDLADENEGGLRCTACFEMRLELVAEAGS